MPDADTENNDVSNSGVNNDDFVRANNFFFEVLTKTFVLLLSKCQNAHKISPLSGQR